MKADDELLRRISDALHISWRGRLIETSDDRLVQDIAWEIPALRAMGREAYFKKEAEARAWLKKSAFKDEVFEEEAWLPLALVEAAEKNLSRVIDDLTDGGDDPVDPGYYHIVAYAEVQFRENRPPLIGELLKQLGIEKPRRTFDNVQEWSKLDSREREIRKILTRFNLPLSPTRAGRKLGSKTSHWCC